MNDATSMRTTQSSQNLHSWTRFVSAHPAAHFLQLREWGVFKEKFGWTSSIVALDEAGTSVNLETQNSDRLIHSGAQLLYRSLAPESLSSLSQVVGLKLAYVPKGPLVNWHDEPKVEQLLTHIEAECRRQGAGILKIEPELVDSPANRALLSKRGFQPSPQTVQPRSTMLLDISDDEAQILARMKSKWRYNIRLSARKDVTVRRATAADLPSFHTLMQTTGERNGFHVHEAAYYEAAFHTFVPNFATFLIAEYQGEPLASVVVMAAGKNAWYPWGASSNRERNRMPNYALHWAAIRWAKAQGAELYDFWGIPDPIGEMGMAMEQATERGIPAADVPVDLQNLPDGELWGVYRLKQGFGGNVFRTVGAWDKPIRPVSFKLYQAGLVIREQIPVARNRIRELLGDAPRKALHSSTEDEVRSDA